MLEKQQKRKKDCMQFFYQVGFILILYGENNGNLKKNKNIPGNLFVVIISPFTNHFTAGVIIEFQAEITVYCDTCTRETIH